MVGSIASHLDHDIDLDHDHDHDHHMMDAHDGDTEVPPSAEVSCSICLDVVSDTGGRSRAKLHCGHEFHLDCIGSAFNTKGAMQCPNCRKVEKGQWLYANGSTRSVPELTMEDWNLDDDYYDPGYTEMPFRGPWCPFHELARIASLSEEGESPSPTNHEIHGHHAIFAEHAVAPSVAHSYVAYVGPLPPTTLRSSNNGDDPNFNCNWNSLSGHNEIFIPHALPTISIQFHSWGWHSPNFSVSDSHISNTDPASVLVAALRSSAELDGLTGPRSFPHPFPFEHGSSSRAGSSLVSSVFPRHAGSGAHTRERIQASLAFYHQQHRFNQQHFNRLTVPAPVVPGMRRGLAPVALAVPQPDQGGGFYIYPPTSSGQNLHEAENLFPNNYNVLEREHLSHFPTVSRETVWGLYNPTSSSDPGNRSRSFLHRHFA